MLAVVVADSCKLVEEGSFWWWVWGCFIPFSAVVLSALASVFVFGAVRVLSKHRLVIGR